MSTTHDDISSLVTAVYSLLLNQNKQIATARKNREPKEVITELVNKRKEIDRFLSVTKKYLNDPATERGKYLALKSQFLLF